MIGQAKCSIAGILRILFVVFAFNISILYSSSNVAKREINEDEQINRCENWQFQCKNGQCIAKSFICDELENCKDVIDETYIECQNKSPTEYKECIEEKKYQCDSIKQCTDESDELHKICNVIRNQPSLTTRIKRNVDESCAVPASSSYKNVTIYCNEFLSTPCDPSSGYVPDFTHAKITCAAGYFEESASSDGHICHKKKWLPAITNCTKKCDKLNAANFTLYCYRNGVQIVPCNENSVLFTGTKVHPLCKPPYTYDSGENSFEITCNEDGKWNASLPFCVPQCGKPHTEEIESRMQGGQPEINVRSPWNAAVFDKNKLLICGGTIISANIVLSAAHCFVDDNTDHNETDGDYTCEGIVCTDDFDIVVGKYTNDYNVTDNPYQRTMKIKEIRFPKEGYQGINTRYTADLAILILKEPIPIIPEILPACLNWTDLKINSHPSEGALGKVAGWGRTENGTLSKILRTANQTVISRQRCLEMVPKDVQSFVTIDKFCANDMQGNSTGAIMMDGDSGGGFLIEDNGFYYLRGIVSVKPASSVPITAFTDLSKHITSILSVFNDVEPNSNIDQIQLNDGPKDRKLQINQEEMNRRLVAETVDDIISEQFFAAESKLRQMDDDTYYYVVHKVYNNQAANFDLLMKFSYSIENIGRKFKIYEFLYEEAASNGLNDPRKLLQFSQAVKKGILNRSSGFLAAEELYQNLNNATIRAAVWPIFIAYMNDNSWSTVKQLSADIADECMECVIQIYSSVVETVWDEITVEELLSRTRKNLKYTEEMIAVHLAVIDKLQQTGALNSSSAITLAFYMDLTMNFPNYRNVQKYLRSRYEEARHKLPQPYQNSKEVIVKSAIELISSAFQNDNSWLKVNQLFIDIDEECPVCTVEIFNSVVEKLWHKNSLKYLLCSTRSKLRYIQAQMKMHEAVANKLESIGALNTSSAIILDYYMHQTIKFPHYDELNQTLRSNYEMIKKKLLPSNVENNSQKEANPQLLLEIVDDIKSQRFPVAQQKLLQKDDNTYFYVVHEVYQDQPGNLDLLLKLGDSIANIEDKFKVYKFLFNVTASSGLKDPRKFLQFSQAMKKGILNRVCGFLAAEELYQDLNDATIKAAVEPISLAFLNDDSWLTAKQLSDDIADECMECAVQMYRLVVDTVWDNITVEELLNIAHENLTYIEEMVAIHLSIMDKLERVGALNTSSAITLAFYMNLTMNFPNYGNMPQNLRFRYEEAKKKFPPSYQNVKEAITKSTIELISLAFQNDNLWLDIDTDRIFSVFQNDTRTLQKINQLLTIMDDECPECIVEIFHLVVDKLWDKLNVEYLLSRTRLILKRIKDNMMMHEAVADKLQRMGVSSPTSVVMLAQYMNETMDLPQYHEVDQNLRSHYEIIKNKLPQSAKKQNRKQEEVTPQLVKEIIDDIKSQRFSVAKQKLLQKADNIYYRVVHELFNNQADNFDLLLKYCDTIENIGQKFKIYKYLYNEITSNGFNDPLMLLLFSKAVKKGILDRSSGFSAAEQLFQNLNNATIKAAVEPITLGFIDDDSWLTVEELSNADITEECNQCAVKIYSSVVEKVWCKINIEHLLTRASKLRRIPEIIAIHVAVTDKLERIVELNKSSAIMLTFYMNLTMNLADYNKVKSSIRYSYEKSAKKLFQYHQNWKEAIVKPAVKLISSAVENDNSWLTVEKLSSDIYNVCEECSLEIYSSVIEKVWNKVTLFELLNRTHTNLRYSGEIMNIHLILKNKLQVTDTFYTNSAITLARFMKQTMDSSNYKAMDSCKQSQYEEIKNKLPQSVRNIVFSSTICIKSTKFNKYISPVIVSQERNAHLVYTFTPEHKDQQITFKWNVSFIGLHDIYLRNDYFNEYLYVDTATRDDLLRYVFTLSTDNFNKKHAWDLEVDGDYILLRSKIYKEYLCVGSVEGENDNKHDVFTYRPGCKTNASSWEIYDCS